MKSLRNALVWTGLTIGLPGVLWSMTTSDEDPYDMQAQHAQTCDVCRQCRTIGPLAPRISDPNIIMVSPEQHATWHAAKRSSSSKG
jgi:hypothetical protein